MAGAVSLQNTTMNPNIILDTSQTQEYPKFGIKRFRLHYFKCKFGPKCDENTQKMADAAAPNFGHTANPQVGSSLVSKSSSNQV